MSGAPTAFFTGGGEMGARMRALRLERERRSARPRAGRQSLRSAASIMLNSRYPICDTGGRSSRCCTTTRGAPILGSGSTRGRSAARRARCGRRSGTRSGRCSSRSPCAGEGTWSEDELLPMRPARLHRGVLTSTSRSVRSAARTARWGGVFNAVVRRRRQHVIAERAGAAAVRELADRTSSARSVDGRGVRAGRRGPRHGARGTSPFALLYLLDGDAAARLGGAVGLAADSPAARRRGAAGRGGAERPRGAHGGPRGAVRRAVGRPVARGAARRARAAGGALRAGAPTPFSSPAWSARRALDDGLPRLPRAARRPERRRHPVERALRSRRSGAARERSRSWIARRRRSSATSATSCARRSRCSSRRWSDALADARRRWGPRSANALEPCTGTPSACQARHALLDFSRVEAGRARAEFERPRISRALDHGAGQQLSLRWSRARGSSLVVACAAVGAPSRVDRAMWEKSFLNLLSNAFKFTFAGGDRGWRWRAPGRASSSRSRDTGIRHPGREQPRIFERFHRVGGARARRPRGHRHRPLARARARLAARRNGSPRERGTGARVDVRGGRCPCAGPPPSHGSDSGVSSPPGACSDRRRSWPRWRSGTIISSSPPPSAVLAGGGRPRAPRARVLVVDDNADMRAYLARLLSPHWARGDLRRRGARCPPAHPRQPARPDPGRRDDAAA